MYFRNVEILKSEDCNSFKYQVSYNTRLVLINQDSSEMILDLNSSLDDTLLERECTLDLECDYSYLLIIDGEVYHLFASEIDGKIVLIVEDALKEELSFNSRIQTKDFLRNMNIHSIDLNGVLVGLDYIDNACSDEERHYTVIENDSDIEVYDLETSFDCEDMYSSKFKYNFSIYTYANQTKYTKEDLKDIINKHTKVKKI